MKKRNSHDRKDEERHTANSEQQNIFRRTDRPIAEPSTEQRCGGAVGRNGPGRSTEETVGGADAGGWAEPSFKASERARETRQSPQRQQREDRDHACG